MNATDLADPPRRDVEAALLWALDHNREALLAHREVVQFRRWDTARAYADRRLVSTWQAAQSAVLESTTA